MSCVFPKPSKPYLNDSPSLSSSLRWQTYLNHRMLQPAHLMRLTYESVSQWLQPPKWDAAGTSAMQLHQLKILMGAVEALGQRQTCRNATSAITGAAATVDCGTSARRRRSIVSEVQHLRRAVAHQHVYGTILCLRAAAAAGCGILAR